MVLIAAIFDKLLMEKLRNRSGQRENAAITGKSDAIIGKRYTTSRKS